MTPEEMKKALDDKFKEVNANYEHAVAHNASKEELAKAVDAIKAQGEALEDFIESQKQKVVKGMMIQFKEFLGENEAELERIKSMKSGEISFVPKVVGALTTGSGSDIDTPTLDVSTNLGSFNLRNDNALLSLMTVSSTNRPSYNYTELSPKDGGYGFVLEAGTKPQIDFKWENRYTTPKKAAAHERLTEESVTDYPRLMSVAKEYLLKQHDLFKVSNCFFADGLGDNPTGATTYGRTFVAGGMADFFAAGTSNFMDVVNAIITDIYTTQNYTDEASYEANIVLINPVDFFKYLVGAKDGNGLPLYPQAGLFNQVRIGGVLIKPWIKMPAGKIFVADMSKYNVVNYVPFTIRIGWINDQFITNQFSMVGESRFFQYVKNLDQGAFVYDDIATVQAAITAA
jgi:HK97 family phage major capsid protein